MLYIDGLDLTNVVSFKEVSVDFKEALTYIRGVNKDSDPVRPTGNGTGKSLFFSSIPNVWYSSTPLALRKKSRKDILARKGSSIGLIYRPGDDAPEYEIIQQGGGYKIFENGKDLEIPTIPKAEAFIKKIFPISEIDFYSRCYISTQRPYSLLRDSDSDRLQHIVDIARLDQYSLINKYFSVKASSIKDNEIRLSVLEQQQATLARKLKEASSSISKDEYARCKKEYAELDKHIKKLQDQRYALLSRSQALEALLTVEKELDVLRAKYSFKEKPSSMLKTLKATKMSAREWVLYEEGEAQVEKARKKLKAKMAELEAQLPEMGAKELAALLKQTRTKIESLTTTIEEQDAQKEKIEDLATDVETYTQKLETLNVDTDAVDLSQDYEGTLAEIRIRLKLESLLDHEDSTHSKGSCPTCQADIDFASIRKLVSQEKKNLSKYQALSAAQRLLKAVMPAKKELKSLRTSFDESGFASNKKVLKKLVSSCEVYTEHLAVYKQLASYTEQYEELELPEKPTSAKPNLSLSDIEAGIELCHEIEKHLSAKATLIESNADFDTFRSVKAVKREVAIVEENIAQLDKQVRSKESNQADIASKITSYEHYLNTVKVYKEESASVEAEIAKLKPVVADKKLITILTKAYGTKGLRSYAANSFCNLLQTNLNHYRDLIFAEPFEFSVEASDTGVSILVDRNNGKTDAVSDVRHLSGAESECFALLCAASLVTLTPDSRKLNMMVLDEPTSHLHPVTKDLFTTRFLPFLRDLVPTIFVIDNTEDAVLENSQQWTIIKSKGVSKLQLV